MAQKIQILSTKFPPPCKMPELPYPITPRENLKLLFEHKTPVWMPNTNRDMQSTAPVNDLERPANRVSGLDWFGQTWDWVDQVGGHMVAANSWRIKDIYNWENELVFPDLDKFDFTVGREEAEKKLDRTRMIRYTIMNCLFERLLDLTDVTESFCWMIEEPESASRFFEAMADFRIKLIDKLVDEWVPIDIITLSDDWGTQASSFMSPATYEEIIYPQIKRIADHIREKGMYPSIHSCGKIENLVPIFKQAGFVFWEAQGNNDLLAIKQNHGKDLNLRLIFDRPLMETPGVTDEELDAAIHEFVDTLGKDGGILANIWSPDAHVYVHTIEEMYRYSLEQYAK